MIYTHFHFAFFIDNRIYQQLVKYVGAEQPTSILLTSRINGTIIWSTQC